MSQEKNRPAVPKSSPQNSDDEFVVFDESLTPLAEAPAGKQSGLQPVQPTKVAPVVENPTSPLGKQTESGDTSLQEPAVTIDLTDTPDTDTLKEELPKEELAEPTPPTPKQAEKIEPKKIEKSEKTEKKEKPKKAGKVMSEYDEPAEVATPRRGFLITPLRFIMLAILLGASYAAVWLYAYDAGVVVGQQNLPPVVYADGSYGGEAERLISPEQQGTTPPDANASARSSTTPPASADPRDSLNIYNVARGDDSVSSAVAPPPTRNTAPTALPNQSLDGRYSVQLASLRTTSEASRRRGQIKSAQADILSDYDIDIERADLGQRGIYYRVLVNGFRSRQDADSVCRRLTRSGQDCLVKWNE